MILDELKRKLLFDRRRNALDAAKSERELSALIEAVDNAIIEDDNKHTNASAKEIERTLAPLVRRVGEYCRAHSANCRNCPYGDTIRHLVDGRTLCEAADELTDAVKRVRDARTAVEDGKTAIAFCEARIEEMRRAYLDDLEAALSKERASMDALNVEREAAERRLAELGRRYGMKP